MRRPAHATVAGIMILMAVALADAQPAPQPSHPPVALPPTHPPLAIPPAPGMPPSHPTTLTPAAAPLTARLGNQDITARNDRELLGRLLRALIDDYATAHAIEPTDADMAAYRDYVESLPAIRAMRAKKRLGQLHKQLGRADQTDEQRNRTVQEMKDIAAEDTAQYQASAARAGDPAAGEDDQEAIAQVRRARELSVVRRWQLNAALHREYGGRLIYQQLGAEPVDAYWTLIDNAARAGTLTIHPPASLDGLHALLTTGTFVSAGGEEEALKMPWEQQHYLMEKAALAESPPDASAATGS